MFHFQLPFDPWTRFREKISAAIQSDIRVIRTPRIAPKRRWVWLSVARPIRDIASLHIQLVEFDGLDLRLASVGDRAICERKRQSNRHHLSRPVLPRDRLLFDLFFLLGRMQNGIKLLFGRGQLRMLNVHMDIYFPGEEWKNL